MRIAQTFYKCVLRGSTFNMNNLSSFLVLCLCNSFKILRSECNSINPISHELWNDVIKQGGAIMARMDSSHPEPVSRHSKAQN